MILDYSSDLLFLQRIRVKDYLHKTDWTGLSWIGQIGNVTFNCTRV